MPGVHRCSGQALDAVATASGSPNHEVRIAAITGAVLDFAVDVPGPHDVWVRTVIGSDGIATIRPRSSPPVGRTRRGWQEPSQRTGLDDRMGLPNAMRRPVEIGLPTRRARRHPARVFPTAHQGHAATPRTRPRRPHHRHRPRTQCHRSSGEHAGPHSHSCCWLPKLQPVALAPITFTWSTRGRALASESAAGTNESQASQPKSAGTAGRSGSARHERLLRLAAPARQRSASSPPATSSCSAASTWSSTAAPSTSARASPTAA